MKSKNVLSFLVGLFFLPLSAFAGQEPKDSTNITVLSADIGGTNARLRLSQLENGKKHILANKKFKVANYPNVLDVIHEFLKDAKNPSIKSVCLAVAGPIKNGKVKVTNSKWSIDAGQLKKDLEVRDVKLINDFEAIGYGLESLSEKDLYTLQKGKPEKNGLKAFLGAGTGLGVGFATYDGFQYIVHPTEGGHTSFAPSDETQIRILQYLHKKHNIDISTEQLLSGPGEVAIYQYFSEMNPLGFTENKQLKKALEDKSKDAAKEISIFALERHDEMSMETLKTFVSIYGSKTGDLAFTLFPRGGIYVVGNIAATILTKTPFNKIFMQAFKNKDKVSYVLDDFSVQVVLDTEIGLKGAENYAFKLALDRK